MPTTEARSIGKTFKPSEIFSGPSEALARALRVPGFSHAGALVLWLLVSKIGRNDSCWHGQKKLAAELQISVRSLQRLLGELRALGLVQYQQRGVGRSCRYEMLWHEAWATDLQVPPRAVGRRPQRATVRQACRPAVRQIRRTESSPGEHSKTEVSPALLLRPEAAPGLHPAPSRSRRPTPTEQNMVCHSRVDDGETPQTQPFASPEDELKALYEAKAKAPMPALVLRNLKENLELRQIPLAAYVREIRNHAGGRWTNPAGLLITLSREFVQRTMPADPPQPRQAQLPSGKCPQCQGGGYVKNSEQIQHCSACPMGLEVARIDQQRLVESATHELGVSEPVHERMVAAPTPGGVRRRGLLAEGPRRGGVFGL